MAKNKVIFGNQTLIDLTEDTVTENDVLQGATFHDRGGVKRTGNVVVPSIDNCYETTDTLENDLQDSDYVPFYDDSASAKKNTLWSNIKAKLQTFFSNLFVAKSGDSMTGSLIFNKVSNAIGFTGTKATYPMIKFVDNTGDEYGNGIVIGGGGLTVIGGGESADTYASGLSGGEESLYLTNDGNVAVVTNLQSGKSSGKTFTFGSDGTFNSPSTIKQNGTAVSLSGHTHNYAGSSSAGGQANSAAYADLLKYTHTNEINFKGGAQTTCYFNYRNADTDAASATSAITYKFCNYSNDVSKTTLDAAAFTGTAANSNKLQGYTSDTAKTANTIVRRDGNGYIYAQYYNQASGSETATSSSYVMFCNSDGWLRKTPMSTIKSLVDTNTNTWRGFQFLSRTSGSQTIAAGAVATFTFSGLNNVSGYAPKFAWYSGNNSSNKITPCRCGTPCGDGTCSFTVFNQTGAQKTGVTVTIYVLYTQ